MKITKQYLKNLIKEELEKATVGPTLKVVSVTDENAVIQMEVPYDSETGLVDLRGLDLATLAQQISDAVAGTLEASSRTGEED